MKPSDFCPTCHFYLYLNQQEGLILEIDLKEKTSEGYRIIMNEFTAHDPTLPHVTSITCPNDRCGSNTGANDRDVLYLKYDPVNLKFLYHCMVCKEQWRSKA